MKVISLGWGVQSFALAAMSALGELPTVDYAIHSDTTHERSQTYDFAKKWTPWLESRGVKVVTVSAAPKTTSIETGVTPPYFTVGLRGAGMLYRTCTERWKIRPIEKFLKAELKKRGLGYAEKWIGITLDEVERMRPSKTKFEKLVYPFIDLKMRRGDVVKWLQDNELEVPVKSSCIHCPYHDRATWREIKLHGNGDWSKALEIDKTIRNKRPGYECYLTPDRKPLDEIDFRSQEDHGQLRLWAEECTGNCFL